jgi:predicted DNA-binding ribbon-helix-helix protein
MSTRYLAIYLNDHLAGATVGMRLAQRTASSNRNSSYGPELERIAEEIAEDREALKEIMSELDVGEDRVKVLGGILAEAAGRLKLNGQLTGYSPLSRVVEIEGLALGVTGKLALWRGLEAIAADQPHLEAERLIPLIVRAQAQQQELESLRLRAVAETMAQRGDS